LNSRLVASSDYSTRKAVSFTLKNNSNSKTVSGASKAYAVVFNAAGVPIYAESGYIGRVILPGEQTQVAFGDFTFNGEYSYIQITLGVYISGSRL
jgi:hypothetical protein